MAQQIILHGGNADYRRGYAEAAAVFRTATLPGYTKNREEAHMIARAMLNDGLTAQEASRQRANYIAQFRQRGQAIQQMNQVHAGNETPPADSVSMDSVDEIFKRRAAAVAAANRGEAIHAD